MLNQTNIDSNNNKYYVIQLLQNDSNGSYATWNRWGRVGLKGQNKLQVSDLIFSEAARSLQQREIGVWLESRRCQGRLPEEVQGQVEERLEQPRLVLRQAGQVHAHRDRLRRRRRRAASQARIDACGARAVVNAAAVGAESHVADL
jgi:predicted DNA-binding WGR domain protein